MSNYLLGCDIIGAGLSAGGTANVAATPTPAAAKSPDELLKAFEAAAKTEPAYGPISEEEARAQGWKPTAAAAVAAAIKRDPFADLAPQSRAPVPGTPPGAVATPTWKKAVIGGGIGVGIVAVLGGLLLALRRR